MTYHNSIHIPSFTFRLLTLMMALTFLAGCGDGKSSKGPDIPKPLQACDLLTKADVEAVIGGSVDEPRKTHNEDDNSQSWMSMCNYYSDEKSISAGIMIIPHGRKVKGAEAFALYEAQLKEHSGDDYSKMEIIDKVGDYAGWNKAPKQLTIFQGPFMLIVSGGSPEITGDAALELNKQLAVKVLAKLPK